MIFNFQNMDFLDDEWKYIILQYLKEWTEIPLDPNYGYDIEELKFFDGFLGTLLKQTEFLMKECPSSVNEEFVNSWKYQGKLYRVIHSNYVFDDNSIEPRSVMPKVDYHRMITHWTDDYTFDGLMYKLSKDEEYIILEVDTKEHFAFDVNKFRRMNNQNERFTYKEREFIFPMYKENIKEYRTTIRDFVKMKELEKLETKSDVQ